MFQFVKDRKAQGSLGGQYAPIADQEKFVSIYAVVDGPMGGCPWTAVQVEEGGITSADGRARLGGVAVKDKKGAFHDIRQGNTVLREYAIPRASADKWNAYEAAQANQQADDFMNRELAKAEELGRAPELKTSDEEAELDGVTFDTTGSPDGERKRRKSAA